jgi:hypothetical protein
VRSVILGDGLAVNASIFGSGAFIGCGA